MKSFAFWQLCLEQCPITLVCKQQDLYYAIQLHNEENMLESLAWFQFKNV